MEWGLIFQLLSIALTVAILVVLIVLLARNAIQDTTDENMLKLNNKINALYILEIVAVSIMIVFAVIGFFMYRRLPAMC